MNNFISSLAIAREMNALRSMQPKRQAIQKGVSIAFKECPRGTPGCRALRWLKDACVARAIAKGAL